MLIELRRGREQGDVVACIQLESAVGRIQFVGHYYSVLESLYVGGAMMHYAVPLRMEHASVLDPGHYGENSFETWLGSIISPGEKFYLLAESETALNGLITRVAKIGYESQIELGIVGNIGNVSTKIFDSNELRDNKEAFTIVDIRNPSEVKTKTIFENSCAPARFLRT